MSESARVEAIVGFSLVALLLIGGSLTTEVTDPNPDLRASSFVNDRAGLRALYLVLEESGIDVTRRLEAVTPDTPADRTVVMAAPTDPVLDTEIDDLLAWVGAGGRLVVVDQPPAPPFHPVYTADLLAAVGLHSVRGPLTGGTSNEGLSYALPRNYDAFRWQARLRLEPVDPEHKEPGTRPRDARAGDPESLVAPNGDVLAARIRFGQSGGEVVVVSDSRAFDNVSLGDADNALLAVDLVTGGDGRGAKVEFDEFHHGFRPDGQRGGEVAAVLRVLTGTWPGRAVLLLGLAWLVWILGRGVRFGAADREPRRRRRALTEHTAALGDIFRIARSRRLSLQLLGRGARRVVGPRAGLSTHLPPEEFDRRLARSSAPGAAELARALTATQSAVLQSDTEFARRARALAEARHAFVRGGGPGSDTPKST